MMAGLPTEQVVSSCEGRSASEVREPGLCLLGNGAAQLPVRIQVLRRPSGVARLSRRSSVFTFFKFQPMPSAGYAQWGAAASVPVGVEAAATLCELEWLEKAAGSGSGSILLVYSGTGRPEEQEQ